MISVFCIKMLCRHLIVHKKHEKHENQAVKIWRDSLQGNLFVLFVFFVEKMSLMPNIRYQIRLPNLYLTMTFMVYTIAKCLNISFPILKYRKGESIRPYK